MYLHFYLEAHLYGFVCVWVYTLIDVDVLVRAYKPTCTQILHTAERHGCVCIGVCAALLLSFSPSTAGYHTQPSLTTAEPAAEATPGSSSVGLASHRPCPRPWSSSALSLSKTAPHPSHTFQAEASKPAARQPCHIPGPRAAGARPPTCSITS